MRLALHRFMCWLHSTCPRHGTPLHIGWGTFNDEYCPTCEVESTKNRLERDAMYAADAAKYWHIIRRDPFTTAPMTGRAE